MAAAGRGKLEFAFTQQYIAQKQLAFHHQAFFANRMRMGWYCGTRFKPNQHRNSLADHMQWSNLHSAAQGFPAAAIGCHPV